MKTALRLLLAPPIDSDVIGWKSRVIAAGGTVSSGTVLALSRFSKACKAAGLWDKLNRVNLFCGDQLTAALVPLKVGAGNATDTNVNFVSGDYTEAAGITGNGSSKYLNTGMLLNALTANDTHLSVYNRGTGGASSGIVTIGGDTGGNSCTLFATAADFKLYSDQYNSGTGRVVTASTISSAVGFIVGSRTAANSHNIYRGGSSVATNATSGGSFPAVNCYVMARNNAGAAANFSIGPAAGYSIGTGLTASEVAAYNTIMEAFQDALGRGVQ